jgi:hypothetical protein
MLAVLDHMLDTVLHNDPGQLGSGDEQVYRLNTRGEKKLRLCRGCCVLRVEPASGPLRREN